MKNFVRSLLSVVAVTFIATHTSFARLPCTACDIPSVPEIDPAMATGALALLGGAVMVIRGRAKRKS